jgi:alginate O-acetyltransferase complex protein AlgJ
MDSKTGTMKSERIENDLREAVVRYGGHLFISGDTNHINEQHQGLVTIPLADQEQWLQIMEARARFSKKIGAEFLFILAPDKQTVYRHLLPQTFSYRPASFLTKLPFVIDVAPVLSAVSKIVELYPRTDSHWNQLGSYLAVQAVQARRGVNMPDQKIDWIEDKKTGDPGVKLSPQEYAPCVRAKLTSNASLVYDNLIPNNGRVRVFSKSAAECTKPPSRLMLFGDSFSYDLIHFLKETFDIVFHVHGFALDYAVAEKFKPDLVIGEITERFVLRLPTPGDGAVLSALWQDKVLRKTPLELPHGITTPTANLFPAEVFDVIEFAEEMFAPFKQTLSGERM